VSNFKEKVEYLTSAESTHKEFRPTAKLLQVIQGSFLPQYISELKNIRRLSATYDLIENGRKAVICEQWTTQNKNRSQIIISVTEDSIAFIGDPGRQYIRLEAENLGNKKLFEESLLSTFSNPQRLG
jgi:hypothetical protein